jgi:hypothetical protein
MGDGVLEGNNAFFYMVRELSVSEKFIYTASIEPYFEDLEFEMQESVLLYL